MVEDNTVLMSTIIAFIVSATGSYMSYFFSIKKADKDARRDYEYEAKKRLYQECEPILFEFSELSESALKRIYALAKNAKEGNLGPNRYWLSTDHYFIRSTIYRLIAPLAAFKLLQHKLTNIDLKMDYSINIQYILAKILYYTFSSSPDLAKSNPAIFYDPDQIGTDYQSLTESDKTQMREKYPERFYIQGLKVGNLDTLSESLIVESGNKDVRIKSFGEFEIEFLKNEKSNLDKKKFETFITMFSFFHPKTRPVLWRVLITQAFLYKAIMNIRNTENLSLASFDDIKIFFDIEKTKIKCDWRQYNEVVSNEEFDIHFKAAEDYLRYQFIDALEFKQMQYKS
jgi:hypothetical protein